MYKFRKILFIFIASILIFSIGSCVFATNTTGTVSSEKVTIFELVEDKSCTMDVGSNGKFEKKVIDFNVNEKSITLQLTLKNTTKKPEIVVKPAELFLVIDNSNSMSENTVSEGITRKQMVLDSANVLAANLLKTYPDLKIGIVSFSSKDGSEGTIADASLEQSLTSNQTEITSALNNIKMTSGVRTNIEAGLTIAEQNFSETQNNKLLVLLSDGVPNNDIHGHFSTYSGEVASNTKLKLTTLNSNGIKIIGSMIGLKGGEIEPSTSKTYQALAEEIFGTPENPTAGKYFYVSDSQIEETIKNGIYGEIAPSDENKLKNIVIKDYFPQEIIDNFNFEYVASPNIGAVSAEVNKSDNSITWKIEVLNEDEVAKLSYKLTLKDNFNKEIIDKILPTNKNVDITYNEDGHVNSDKSPTVRVKLENAPSKPNINTVDNTIANTPVPQTGNNNIILIISIIIISVLVIAVGIRYFTINKL